MIELQHSKLFWTRRCWNILYTEKL